MKIFPSAARCRRLALWLALLGGVVGFYFWRTWWRPDLTVRTPHYLIRSSATRQQTEAAGRALETLHAAYLELFSEFPHVAEEHEALEVCLYRDRRELHRCNPRLRWGEAVYKGGRCHAYYGEKKNRFHWLLHEAVHQLNHKVARLDPPKWIDEGLAEYFATSQYRDGNLHLGLPDRHAYPVWWLPGSNFCGDLKRDIRAERIIPLRNIITGRDGPDIDEKFNLYYIHWWSLSHFLMEGDGADRRSVYFAVIRDGGSLKAVRKHLGPVGELQSRWYDHLCSLRRRP